LNLLYPVGFVIFFFLGTLRTNRNKKRNYKKQVKGGSPLDGEESKKGKEEKGMQPECY
jgi:hypothetical protein